VNKTNRLRRADEPDPVTELRKRWDEFEDLLEYERQRDGDALWVYEAVHDHVVEKYGGGL